MKLGFYENRPRTTWLSNFLKRHSQLSLKHRVSLDTARNGAMNPENIAKHFERLETLIKRYDIRDPTRIFGLNESGIPMRRMKLGRSMCDVKQGERGNTREVKFLRSCYHVILIPVVSAAGQIITPLLFWPVIEEKYRKLLNG